VTVADFLIRVKRLVPVAKLDHDDKQTRPWGLYGVTAADDESALDTFHDKIGIATLDDFEITIEPTPKILPKRHIWYL
jgi:hypothetical protein